MNLEQYMEDRGYQHVVDDFFINGVRQPVLPDEAELYPISHLRADTDAETIYKLAQVTYGEFEGPVELYVWHRTDGSEVEYVTVAGQAFERPRRPLGMLLSRANMFFILIGGLGLIGTGFFFGKKGS